MVFYKNGESLGEAFIIPAAVATRGVSSTAAVAVNTVEKSYFPAFSVDSFQQIAVNIGQHAFKYPPPALSTPTNTIWAQFEERNKEGKNNKTEEVDESQFTPLVDLESDKYDNVESLVKLGGHYLKYELKRRGLKYGGTVEEKAVRLHSVRGVKQKDIPNRIKQTTTTAAASDTQSNKKQKQT